MESLLVFHFVLLQLESLLESLLLLALKPTLAMLALVLLTQADLLELLFHPYHIMMKVLVLALSELCAFCFV